MPSEQPDLSELRGTLERRLSDLRASVAATAEDRKPVELDQQAVGRVSRIDAIQVQAMAVASERMRHGEMRRIEAAIKRIDAGEYGFCVRCGDAIAPQRLAVDATIATCMACAAPKA